MFKAVDGERETDSFMNELKNEALSLGASDAVVIPAAMVSIEDRIVELCREPLCDGYGKSLHCPPHAMKPTEARKLLKSFHTALLFKVDVAPSLLLSDERFEAFKVIYNTASKLEEAAVRSGYALSRGFAAGSCKSVFCRNLPCKALTDKALCRYPSLARPSMEAVGINVFRLVREAGWEIHFIARDSDPEKIPKGLLAGLVFAA
jgi:predicted metal-binding protein